MAAETVTERPGAPPGSVLHRAAGELIRTSPPAVVTPRTLAAVVGALLAATVLLLARQRGHGALDTIWAEDGNIFLTQVRSLGVVDSLLEPYAGYVHIVPRLAAAAVSVLPLESADTGLALLASLCTAACALFVYRASSAHVRTGWARVACAAPLVVSPLAGTEILASIANLHWFLLYTAFWAVTWRAPSRWETALAAAFAGGAILSDPFALVLLPVIALRLVARGGRPDAVSGAFAVGTVVQVLGMLGASGQRELGEEAEVPLLPFRYVVDVLGRGLAGDRVVGESGLSARGMVVGAAVLAFVLAVAVVRRRVVRERAVLLVVLLGASVTYFVAPVALSGVSTPRYAFAPALLLFAALVVVLDGGDASGARRWDRALVPAAAATLAVLWVIGLPSYNGRDRDLTWDGALATAAASCTPGEDVDVPVLPEGFWTRVACRDVIEAVGR